MAILAVDVFSGSPDYVVRDSHAQAVIVKATQGTGYVNPACNHQYALAKSLGKKLGLYHYAGGGNPEAEARYFIGNIKNYVGTALLALDWESNQNASWGNAGWCLRFVTEVHRLTGVWPIIYVQESALWQVANCASVCGVWVAKYPYYTNGWTVPNMSVSSGAFKYLTGWQFTGGDMDRDIFYLDSAAWDRLANPTATKAGWSETNGLWQYVDKNGAKLVGWQKLGGHWYFFDANGYASTGWQEINNRWYCFDKTNAWALTGWNQINDKWYYMDPTNAWCATGWQKLDDRWFYFDTKNAWLMSGLQVINGHTYYLNPKHDGTFGAALTGWQECDGKKYYFDKSNCWAVTGKQTIDGVEYVFADNGSLQGQKQQPVQPNPNPVKKSTLSDADRQAIENDLKPYIQEVVKQELANNGR